MSEGATTWEPFASTAWAMRGITSAHCAADLRTTTQGLLPYQELHLKKNAWHRHRLISCDKRTNPDRLLLCNWHRTWEVLCRPALQNPWCSIGFSPGAGVETNLRHPTLMRRFGSCRKSWLHRRARNICTSGQEESLLSPSNLIMVEQRTYQLQLLRTAANVLLGQVVIFLHVLSDSTGLSKTSKMAKGAFDRLALLVILSLTSHTSQQPVRYLENLLFVLSVGDRVFVVRAKVHSSTLTRLRDCIHPFRVPHICAGVEFQKDADRMRQGRQRSVRLLCFKKSEGDKRTAVNGFSCKSTKIILQRPRNQLSITNLGQSILTPFA